MDLEARAIAFANRVKNLNRFMTLNVCLTEIYGCRQFSLDARALRRYYEHHEPNAAWRDFSAFRATIEYRIDLSRVN